jgi:MFS family permease
MCFLMGVAAGGMLPVAYALLAEIMPARHRGWSLVLVEGIGAVGGYFAASSLSALLQPAFGWRIMWFSNLPTGLLLVGLSPLLPESARFGVILNKPITLLGNGIESARAPLPPVDRQFIGATASSYPGGAGPGIGQFRRAGVASYGAPGRRPERGRLQRANCRIDPDCRSHNPDIHLALQSVERQVVTCDHDRAHATLARRQPA